VTKWPEMPDGVEDRDADVWEALLSVADVAGGDWPKRGRCAAVTLVTAAKSAPPSMGVRLLEDLRTVFTDSESEHMFTDDILNALVEMELAPWGDIRGKALDARSLARRLARYEIKPRTVRIGEKTSKGYARTDLSDVWSRYLTSVTDDLLRTSKRITTEPVGNENGLSSAHLANVTSVTTSQTEPAPTPTPDDSRFYEDAAF
jgi:hypothetical protein